MCMQDLFKPAHLESTFTELLALGNSHYEEVSPTMVDHLEQLTQNQSKSKEWFKYRAGRITASQFRQVLHTDPHKPSVLLLRSVCYPESNRCSTQATVWGCEHEKDARQAYKSQMIASHDGLAITSSGFFVSTEHPYLGASPDALIEFNCCGMGEVSTMCSGKLS